MHRNNLRCQVEGPPHTPRKWQSKIGAVSKLTNGWSRVRPRFFDQVGHEPMYASSGNKHFFTKSCYCQTYQNYEQSRQKLGTIL